MLRPNTLIGILLLAVLLTGCVPQTVEPVEPTPTPSETAVIPEAVTVDQQKTSNTESHTFTLPGLQVTVTQTGYGLATEGQIKRWFGEPTDDDTLLHDEWAVVSLRFSVSNTTGSNVELATLGLGVGRWILPDNPQGVAGELTSLDDTGLVDFTDNSLHERLELPTYPSGVTLPSGETKTVNIDVLVPKSITDGTLKEAKYLTHVYFASKASAETEITLTFKE